MTVKRKSKKQPEEKVEEKTANTKADSSKRIRKGYDEETVVKASYMSRKTITEQPELTKGENLLYSMLNEAFGFEFGLHSHHGVPRWVSLNKGPAKGFSMRGTPKGLAVAYNSKTLWVGDPDDVVSAIRKLIKEHPESKRTPRKPPVKKATKKETTKDESKKEVKSTKKTKKTSKK